MLLPKALHRFTTVSRWALYLRSARTMPVTGVDHFVQIVPDLALQPGPVLLQQPIGTDAGESRHEKRETVDAVVEHVDRLVEEVNRRRDVAVSSLPRSDGPVERLNGSLAMLRGDARQRRGAEAEVTRPELAEVARAGSVVRSVPAVIDACPNDLACRPAMPAPPSEAAPGADGDVDGVCRGHHGALDELPIHAAALSNLQAALARA